MFRIFYLSLCTTASYFVASPAIAQSSSEHHEKATPIQEQTQNEDITKESSHESTSNIVRRLLRKEASDDDIKAATEPPKDNQSVINEISKILSTTSPSAEMPPLAENAPTTPENQTNPKMPEEVLVNEKADTTDSLKDEEQTPDHKVEGAIKEREVGNLDEDHAFNVEALPERIKLKAIINYKGFSKPITTCRAQILNVSQGTTGSLFEIEGNIHLSNSDAIPPGSSHKDKVKINFSNPLPYGSSSCQKHNLETEEYPLEDLISLLKDSDFAFTVEPNNTLFIAYVNMQSEKIHRSIARWRETLDITNSIYKTGVSSKKWTDGILIGPDKDGKISPIFMPLGNFPAEIMTSSNLLEIATELSTQPRQSFTRNPSLNQISERYNAGDKTAILFISDEYPSCRSAVKSIQASGMTNDQTTFFILPMSDTSNDTGAIKLSSSKKIFRCEVGKEASFNNNIVAFDLFERSENLDWKNAMKQAEKQAEKVEFSREKF